MPATIIISGMESRNKASHWVSIAQPRTVLTFKKPSRTIPQNDRMWAMLTDVSTQAHYNGKKYSPDQWKALFMNACGHEVQFIEGLSGEPFPAGFRTSKLTVEQMTELMDFMDAWGTQNGVKFKEKV